MLQSRDKTAWMWLANDQLRGLSMDLEDSVLSWIWQAGCHCADEDEIVQTVETFRRVGAPPLIGPLPPDVARELEAALASLEA